MKNGEKMRAHRPSLFLLVEGEELKCCVTLKNALMKMSVFKETGHCYCNPLGRSYAASTGLQAQLCQHLFGGSKPTSAVYNEDILNEEERKKTARGRSLTSC